MENSANWHQSQRGYFAGALYDLMLTNKDIYLVTADLGYVMFDRIKKDFPERFVNTGAAEAAAVGICVGLAQEGKIPFFYTISSFLLRAAETIHLYLDQEQANVKLVGGGRDADYLDDGRSHWGYAAQEYLASKNLECFYPLEKEEIPNIIKEVSESKNPVFISLQR